MGWPGAGGPLGGVILGRRPPVMTGGANTKSAGTSEIAKRTGGDSMRVDDASAFETTLERIRERYALHFNEPDGARGEGDLQLELASAVRRRYPDAEVHFRRVSMTGSTADVPESTEVVTPTPGRREGTQVEESGDDPNPPTLRRRRGVDPDRDHGGPMIGGDASSGSGSGASSAPAAQKSGGWPRADQPADTRAGASPHAGEGGSREAADRS